MQIFTSYPKKDKHLCTMKAQCFSYLKTILTEVNDKFKELVLNVDETCWSDSFVKRLRKVLSKNMM